jgi:Zn-dependent peptidase ImmA (M78 family)
VTSREPIKAIGVAAARKVRADIGYRTPTEMEIEVLAFMRGVIVRRAQARGSRANLVRVGDRAIVGVADGLEAVERRWAIAHELGHFEAHPDINFLDLFCSSGDMLPSYRTSGREPEANAFAAELLMPEDLFTPQCDLDRVSWKPIEKLARRFEVSVMAAGLRFLDCTDERVALVCLHEGKVHWTKASKGFGPRPTKGRRVSEWSEAHAYFDKDQIQAEPQTVSASAWLDEGKDDDELVEHVFPLRKLGMAMSLLWWRP